MSAPPRELLVSADDAGTRLDAFVSARAGVSRAAAAKLIAAGAVSVEGALATKSLRVEEAMRVSVSIPEHVSAVPQAEEIPVRVVFEDEHLLVVSKPAGLVVHPAPGHSSGTLVNALLARAGGVPAGGDAERPGIVHRLDAGTSGLMIVTKDEETHAALTEALAARAVTRVYLALVEGVPDTDTTTIDAPIGRSTRDRKKMAVVAGGRPAVTEITVLEELPDTALVEARPPSWGTASTGPTGSWPRRSAWTAPSCTPRASRSSTPQRAPASTWKIRCLPTSSPPSRLLERGREIRREPWLSPAAALE
ncbi:MAG: RluA family pseudouridine synthase [Actinobacteria bacterium]|nr:MAG: RluA family pseudouridine synthase [Actinomycetota bacterium]